MANKAVQEILRACRDQGLVVQEKKDGNSHWVISDAEGRVKVRVSSSPGRGRSLDNTIATLKRELGFVWKGRTSKGAPRYVDRAKEVIEDVPAEPVSGGDRERRQSHARSARSRRR